MWHSALLLQLVIILSAALVLGALFCCCGQPGVIGEMAAGCSARLLDRNAAEGRPEGALLATLLVGTFACAYVTHWLGVHAVFGAFLVGACLPRDDRLLHSLIECVEHAALLVLLPVFFALARSWSDEWGDTVHRRQGWMGREPDRRTVCHPA